MRLQTERAPNPTNRHAAESGGLSQTARAPMRLSPRRAFQGLNDHLFNLGIAHTARCPRRSLIIDSLQPALKNRERHLTTMPGETRSLRATSWLLRPPADA